MVNILIDSFFKGYNRVEISFIAAACLLIPAINNARSRPAMANLSQKSAFLLVPIYRAPT